MQWRVVVVADAAEALAAVAQRCADLLVLDVIFDGADLARCLAASRVNAPAIPIIVLGRAGEATVAARLLELARTPGSTAMRRSR
jgi:DNA-binding response OmpR family regulator